MRSSAESFKSFLAVDESNISDSLLDEETRKQADSSDYHVILSILDLPSRHASKGFSEFYERCLIPQWNCSIAMSRLIFILIQRVECFKVLGTHVQCTGYISRCLTFILWLNPSSTNSTCRRRIQPYGMTLSIAAQRFQCRAAANFMKWMFSMTTDKFTRSIRV